MQLRSKPPRKATSTEKDESERDCAARAVRGFRVIGGEG